MNSYPAQVICYSALFLGGGSLVAFTVFLLSGSFQLVDLGLHESAILFFDSALSLIFFIQHSGMMRKTFRKKAERIIVPEYYLAVYAIASGITLVIMLVFWQQSNILVFSAKGIVQWIMWILFFLAGVCFMLSAAALGEFDPFGVKNIKNHLRGRTASASPFIVKGAYRLVRHPLYSCMILMIWLCPYVTADRLVFNVLFSVWIVIGAFLEERDLVDVFGKDYQAYQAEVPMLFPAGIFKDI